MAVLLPVLAWWLALEIIGWAAVPVAFRLFATLPDRGLTLSRPLGLLLVGYLYWLGVTTGALPNSRAGAVFAVLALVALGVWLWSRDRGGLESFLRDKSMLIWTYEWLFFIALAGWALYRAHVPNIETAGGEKYMEMAFIDAVLASPRFPPLDPWLSGFAISYYHFGYILVGLLIKLTGVLSYAAFNLIVPGILAMSLVSAAGLGYNLVALSGETRRAVRIGVGAITAGLLAVVGSLEGALELGYIRGWGPPGFYNWLDIKELTVGPGSCGEVGTGFGAGGWVPHRFLWWWRGSRVIQDNCGEVIHEFPFFSFMLSDAHPHVLALPMALVVLGLALAVLAGALEQPGERRYWSWRWLALPLVVGSLGFLNAWDLPTYALVPVVVYGLRVVARRELGLDLGDADLALFGLAWLGSGWLAWKAVPTVLGRLNDLPAAPQEPMIRVGLAMVAMIALAAAGAWLWQRARDGDLLSRQVIEIVRFAVWLVVLALALYLPFHVAFSSQAAGIGVVAIRSRLPQWLVHFGLLFLLAVSLVALQVGVVRRRWRELSPVSLAVLVVVVPVAGLALAGQAWTALVLTVAWAAGAIAGIEGWAAALGSGTRHGVVAVEEEEARSVAGGAAPSREGAGAAFDGAAAGGERAVGAAVGAAADQGDQRDQGDQGDQGEAGAVVAKIFLAEPASAGLPVAATFALLSVAVGLLLPLGTEFLFVRDLFNSRMNSVFKLYFQAWTLLSIGGGYAVYIIWRRLPRWAASLWTAPLAMLVAASLVYPVAATYTRTRRPIGTPLSLNGLMWWEKDHPGDLAAVQWLKENAPGTPVILEAYGGGYEHNGRISMATGFPTVLGWEGHEHQWRGTREEIDPRKVDVERAFTTGDEAEFRAILAKYGVRYVVVGASEIGKFGLNDADIDRFERWLTPVFDSGDAEPGRARIFERQ